MRFQYVGYDGTTVVVVGINTTYKYVPVPVSPTAVPYQPITNHDDHHQCNHNMLACQHMQHNHHTTYYKVVLTTYNAPTALTLKFIEGSEKEANNQQTTQRIKSTKKK